MFGGLGTYFGGQDLVSANFYSCTSTYGSFKDPDEISGTGSWPFWPYCHGLNVPFFCLNLYGFLPYSG